MTTDYDPIAEEYQRAKQHPWRIHIEAYTLDQLIPALDGQSALDVACGEGHYTRRLRARGAAHVIGVDLSARMIELAQAQEAKRPLGGVEYRIGDGKDLPFEGAFDLAFAAYFLNYAHDRRELQQMCDAVARSLKPGGRFVTVNSSPMLDFGADRSYRQYGFEAKINGGVKEGAPIIWRIFQEDGTFFDIENYFLDKQIHEDAFRAAGFSQVHWRAPRLSPEGEKAFGRDFWKLFLDHPTIAFIECVR
ncbi:class I SAM-dependent methyltransferase [Methylocystis echinoides]|uniref:class I SAM-dependent methyltransferase n=1 Tax=Methylocystis echinoides TaxID=29468 RepID=UPI00342B1F65